MDRRKFLQSVSAVAVGTTALAGCGSPGPGADNETDGNGAGDGDAGLGTDAGEEPMVGTDTPTKTDGGVGTETETDVDVGTETETDMGGDTPTETEDGMETETDVVETTTAGALNLEERAVTTPEGLEVMDTELMREGDRVQVTGTVENTGDETVEEVEVQVTLLDDNDGIIGQFFNDTEEAEVQSLEPGDQWEFTVEFPSEDTEPATAYRIDVDTEIDESVDIDTGGTGTPTETPAE